MTQLKIMPKVKKNPLPMKILLYNIAYSTGLKGSLREYFLKSWRYLWANLPTLQKIILFLNQQNADIICLLETDAGSIRNRFQSQIKTIAEKLFFPFYYSRSKYHPYSVNQLIPLMRKQHDAVLSKIKGQMEIHYLKSGTKKLVQEFIVNNISIFVVHLGLLRKRLREAQLRELTAILKNCPRGYVVCGDFNIFKGLEEVYEFLKENTLRLVNLEATFPAFAPHRTLDLILAHETITIRGAGVLQAPYSDHLPVWVEIDN